MVTSRRTVALTGDGVEGMVGWSSRNTRDARRRRRWWNSLSEEQKAIERARAAREDILFAKVSSVLLLFIVFAGIVTLLRGK